MGRHRLFQLLLFVAIAVSNGTPALPPVPEEKVSPTGFKSADEALAAPRLKPNIEYWTIDDWTVAHEVGTYVVWSFATKNEASYPTAIRRTVVREGDELKVKTDIVCQASKQQCDDVVRYFQSTNASFLHDAVARGWQPGN